MRTGLELRSGLRKGSVVHIRRRVAGARAVLAFVRLLPVTYWAGGRWMQTECMAAWPQFVCSYAWKLPPARPILFERAQRLTSNVGTSATGASPAGHPSVPWKAYLASREFEHLASDLAEAFFRASPPGTVTNGPRPATVLDGPVPAHAGGEPPRGLLAPAVPQGGETALPGELAKAA